MDGITGKKTQLKKALVALEEALDLLQKLKTKQQNSIGPFEFNVLYPVFRESLIQRFEYTIELFWKYLKKLLEEHAIFVEYNAPSPVIRQAFSVGILNEQDAETLLRAIKDRNRTSHIYKEEVAEELLEHIPQYASVINNFLKTHAK